MRALAALALLAAALTPALAQQAAPPASAPAPPAAPASTAAVGAPAAPAPPAPAAAPTDAPAPPALEARTRALFEGLERRPLSAVTATGRGVVSAADPRAAAAGAEMLRRGGSATDAALAIAFALTVVEPQSSGIGGGAFYVHHDGRTGARTTIDGRETAPAAARSDRFLRPDGTPMPVREAIWGGRSVGVPGLVAMAAEAHRRHGRLPWATLFAPAIRLARDGFEISPRLNRTLEARAEMIAASPQAPLFLLPDGAARPVGTRIRNPELAATFERIARLGPAGFYAGPVAEAISLAVSNAPRGAVPLTLADLAAYRPVERAVTCTPYRGWRVCGMGMPSAGSVAVQHMLMLLDGFDLRALGPDSPRTWHLMAEAMRLALADREAWGGDPAFAAIPEAGLLSPAYVASRRALIRPDRAAATVVAGLPPGGPPQAAPAGSPGGTGTSSLAAADRFGNVVALTSTIESIFGSGLTAAGFFLNNELTDFDFVPERGGQPAVNRVEPGKRPRSSMAPLLVYAPDGRLHAALGAAGGATIIAQVAKAIIAMVDWGRTPEQAIAEPVLFASGNRFAYERGSRLEAMAETLAAMGHQPVAADLPLKANALARAPGGRWRAAADPRSEGAALGVR